MKNCPRVECRRVSISMGAIYKAAYGTLSRRGCRWIPLKSIPTRSVCGRRVDGNVLLPRRSVTSLNVIIRQSRKSTAVKGGSLFTASYRQYVSLDFWLSVLQRYRFYFLSMQLLRIRAPSHSLFSGLVLQKAIYKYKCV